MRSVLLVLFSAWIGVLADEPSKAEYAFRWNPRDGGPASWEAVQAILGGKLKSVERYSVRYHTLVPGRNAPPGASAVFRERTLEGADTEYRLKFRSSRPFGDLEVCPSGLEMSYEKDVAFVGGDSLRAVYSLSCTGSDPEIVHTLGARPLPCHSSLARFSAKKYRLEIWALPRNDSILEVSHRAGNSKRDQDDFRELVRKLVGAGARPSGSSKTEMGMECAEPPQAQAKAGERDR